jgi:2-amino-4-hydroxy-6-hydroxymethyldihydropteridine diphosphokinase
VSGVAAIGTLVAIGIGSNVGDRAGHARRAIAALQGVAWLAGVRASRLHETAAVRVEPGVDPGGAYINAAAVGTLAQAMQPGEVLARLLEVERDLGRDRRTQSHGAARVIDLDLLMLGDVVVEKGEGTVGRASSPAAVDGVRGEETDRDRRAAGGDARATDSRSHGGTGSRSRDEQGSDVCLPHRGVGARLFVLEPLAELIPEVIVPVWGRSVRELRALAAARGQ